MLMYSLDSPRSFFHLFQWVIQVRTTCPKMTKQNGARVLHLYECYFSPPDDSPARTSRGHAFDKSFYLSMDGSGHTGGEYI